MKNRRGLIRTIALLVCLVMIGTLLPVMASADLAAPSMKSAKANGTGILVTWGAVAGADSYRVYRKTADTSWTVIGNTTATKWQDNTAAEKVNYTYTVRCVKGGSIVSGYDSIGVSAAWNKDTAGLLGAPTLVSAKNENKGVRFKWTKVASSPGYRVYRKTGSGKWKAIKDVGNVDNYLDTTVQEGKTYTYTVRCLKNGTVVSGYDATGVSTTFSPGYIATPKLVSAKAEGKGLRVVWQAVTGAAAYRVYRKTTGSWAKLVDVKGTSYLDNATDNGTKYTYTVRCLDKNGKIISGYDDKGVVSNWSGAEVKTSTPKLVKTTNAANGVTVEWQAVSGAPKYRVFRKAPGGKWKKLADVTGTSYTDKKATSGQTYIYTVRVINAAGKYISGYDETGLKQTYIAPPELVGTSVLANGIQVNWKATPNTPLYQVYRKVGTGSWKKLAIVSGTSYVDKKVAVGTTYTYTVRALASNKKTLLSSYNATGVTATFTNKSAISSLTNELNGVRAKWVTVNGAVKYQVLRKAGEGGWIELATVTGTEYLDDTAVNNTTYYYRVRAKDSADKFIGSDDTNGVRQTYYVAPTLVNCVRNSGGLLTTWEAVAGVSNYAVYRKYGVGNWELVGTTSGTSYRDMTPPSGTLCYYTVKCADGSGAPISAYRTPGVGETSYMDQPILSAAINNNGTITASWNSVDKATNYRVYRKTGDKTSWDVVQNNTTALSWTDGDVLKGKTYTYSVCVIKSDGSEELSEFNSTGVSVTYYDPPTLTKCANGKTGVDLEWSAVDYIGTYNVYRKTGNNVDWVLIGTKTGTTFTDTNVTSNAHYTYAIRSTVNSGSTIASGYSNTKDTTYYAAPKMLSATNNVGSVSVSWNQEAGIDTYRVYRSTDGGKNWTSMANVSAVSWTDTSANTVGTKYSYAVVCVKDGSEVSAKNDPKTVTYVAPVTNVKVVNATSGGVHKAKVTWTKASGAKAYDVYRWTNGSGWTKAGTVTGTSFVDEKVPSEGYYGYRVVTIANDNSASANSDPAYASIN